MKKRARSIAIILVAFAVTFTSLPIMTGDFKAHAYSTPGQVKTFSATTYSSSSIRLTWKRPSACSGYVLYRNGKYLRVVPKTWTAYNVPGLKPATTYKFQMRAYNVYKRTQYYNSKYRTWTYSKPRSSQWIGRKTRKVNYYRYGKMSPVRTATTGPAKITGLKSTAKTHNTTTIQWTRQTKALTGYVVYRNNAYYKTLGKNTNSLKVTGLKASTAYTYKVRSYLKVGSRNVYGPWSANLKVTTNKAPAVVAPTPTPSVQDTKFANSKLSDKTLYIDKTNSYNDCLYTISTSKDERDAVKWTSNNSAVATVEKDAFNGSASLVVVKGKGTATITATNWDGQKKTATVTVKSVNDNVTPEPEPEEPDNGVIVYEGKVYPANDGVFDLKVGEGNYFKIGDTYVAMNELPTKFPDGATFRINATEVKKETDYYLDGSLMEGVHSQEGYKIGSTKITNISDKSMIIYTPLYSMDASAGGIFFIGSGTCNVTYDNGKTQTFIISGNNDGMSAYRQYVKGFVDNNSGKSKYDIALAAISEALAFNYGPVNDPYAMFNYTVGGNCFAKAQLAHRLMSELGVEAYEHMAFRSNGARHLVLEVIIDGTTYIADPTNREDLVSWETYEAETGRAIEKNRDTYEIHPSIVY